MFPVAPIRDFFQLTGQLITMDRSSDYSSAVVSMVNAAALIGFPIVTPIISAVNPLLQRVIERGFALFSRDTIATVECARLGIAYEKAVNTINNHMAQGDLLREDGFFDALNGSHYTKADEIIEDCLKNVVNDAEMQKSEVYGKFLGSIPFLEGYSASQLISLNSILRQLTVEDIENLKLFSDLKPHDFFDIEFKIKNGGSAVDAHKFASLLHLKNVGLIARSAPFTLGMDLQNEKITVIGKELLDIICS